ncbi:hypothetical protein D3C86_1561200 [compost metagenome]
MAAAPAPQKTTLASSILRLVISRALSSAAEAMIAVPCWSSWKTGMSISALRRSSMMKHSGLLMSSRLIPPKVGPRDLTVWMKRSGSFSSTSMSKTSRSAKRLKRIPFPSITGLLASGPMSPRPSTAVPLVMTPTRLPRTVYSYAASGSWAMARHGSATPGE